MLQKCFGESTLSRTQVLEWHKAFSEGHEVVENLLHASRPSTSVNDDSIKKVKNIVLGNRGVGIRQIAEALNISYRSTQHIVNHVLSMKHVATILDETRASGYFPKNFPCLLRSLIRIWLS